MRDGARSGALPVAASLLVVLLAGCSQTAVTPSPDTPLFARTPFGAFASHDLLDLPGAAEPGIQAFPDGTLATIAWTRIFLSEGAGWRAVDTPFRHNGDSDLAIDDAGTMHVVGMSLGRQVDAGDPALPYWRSSDRGESWEFVADLHPAGPIDRPWIAVAPDGRILVGLNDFQQKRQLVYSSQDGGEHWDRVFVHHDWLPLVSRPVFRGGETWFPMLGSGGVVFGHQSGPGEPWQAIPGPTVGSAGLFTPVAVDGEGTLHMATVQVRDGARQVLHSSSQEGRTWSPHAVVSTGAEAVLPWLVPLEAGVAVVYLQADVPVDERLPVVQMVQPQESVPEWRLVVATRGGSGWDVQRARDDPVHVGSMCLRFDDCPASVPFFDYFEATATPDGGLAIAHVVHADQRPSSQHGLVVTRS